VEDRDLDIWGCPRTSPNALREKKNYKGFFHGGISRRARTSVRNRTRLRGQSPKAEREKSEADYKLINRGGFFKK